MSYGFLGIAITTSVQAAQAANGSAALWSSLEADRASDRFTPNEADFIAARDSFYVATVSETGWPYVQHRGGPPGFLRLLDERTLAFADFRGNRQYLTLGNAAANARVCLFLMDYPNRRRLKIYGRITSVGLDGDRELARSVVADGYRGRPERILKIALEAFDWNCPQHITPRFTPAELADSLVPERERMARLETENRELRARLAAQGG
ncbi:pyridoxamine 5'-phosphate oxidase family protein [Phenylobacterium sp.]|uniref:pyridoxamine 5'-phosphate oxidase family protein n=1 Tax=Phenylobacterium sp. TaxID=1871053 RepID=UPI0035ADAF38